jgi:hypothetical protein
MPQLTVNESAGTLINYVAKLSFTDLQAIGNGGQKNLFKLPAGSGVLSCVVWEKTAIVGSTSLVIDVGTTLADPDEFIDALDVDAMTLPVANTGDAFVQAAGNTTIKGGVLPVSIVATATNVVIEVNDAAIASITAGEIVIALQVIDFSRV